MKAGRTTRKVSETDRYLALLKKSLLDELYLENEARIHLLLDKLLNGGGGTVNQLIDEFLNIGNSPGFADQMTGRQTGKWWQYQVLTPEGPQEFTPYRNFSFTAHTMIGRARLDNIQDCLEIILRDDIPGDLIETGVWKGGATIFMRGFLAARKIRNRKVWVADSFAGLPPPSHAKDQGHDFSAGVFPYLSISLEEVKALFARYDLLDEQVGFLKGWFCDTLPAAPIKKLALLRLDGDLYESTMDALNNLYSKLSPGGFVIVDDYFAFPQCGEAVDEFRARHGIHKKLFRIDQDAVFWRKPRNK